MGKFPRRLMSRQVFLKIQSWAHYSFLSISMTYQGLSSDAKLFADDTSLFSVIPDSSTRRNELNDDLAKIHNWVYQWKMSFNPDPNKLKK